MMNNVTFRFNGLDAQAIADKILERDRRVAEVDFASLSFDDQCRYMAECHRYEYPCMENIGETIDTTELVAKLTERAEAGDPIAAYYLLDYQGYFSVREDKRREIARAAAEAGDLDAVLSYFMIKRRKGYDDSDYDLACGIIESLADAQPSILVSRVIIAAYKVVKCFWHGKESNCDAIIKAEKEKLLGWGHYMTVSTHCLNLNVHIKRATSEAEREALKEEQRFWHTVMYIISDHYQRLIGRRWNMRLAERVVAGRGCEVDYDRAADLFLAALRYRCEGFDRDALNRLAEDCTDEDREIAHYLYLLADGDDASLRALIRGSIEERLGGTARKTYGVLLDAQRGYR